MISYGTLIRQIRKAKKISQKEVYTGIISKSYSIEFEKGTHAISSVLLEKIVAKLMISMEEFLFMYHQGNMPEMEDFWETYEQVSKTEELSAWEVLYKKIALEEGKINQVKRTAIQLEMDYARGIYSVDSESLKIIETYLIEGSFWTLQDIFLFARMMKFIPVKKRAPFYYKLLDTLERPCTMEKRRNILQTLLASILKELVERKDFQHMELMIERLKNLSNDYDGAYYKILCTYYHGIIQWKRGEEDAGNKEIGKAIGMLQFLDYMDKAREYKILYHQLINNQQNRI
ncbi:Rgg/GadR/MutR family transcriptional regulator [Listeria monocytogenes]|uniref:helix-turn-helix domain-containing protein n=1 Tax=Listeria seeligeri TaxID=1640 RepID=UPI0010DFE2B6|nr:Rgg/GadR/MutR family transcriptional regulator [Listeria seeligeri]EAD7205325.1 Rgg/GadR/MutR family transcriptional regulator [Listeria monocytogenes]EAE6945571.1 Rgg/GadR/MutR family transcriptional regulator [Listeria monocytogenes]EAF2599963.1 Rgg/GadR/MutR family transcriptional regulator [Listeria monocytogenes]MBC1788780.1 transcriptional regulator [Listeria seeligeri]